MYNCTNVIHYSKYVYNGSYNNNDTIYLFTNLAIVVQFFSVDSAGKPCSNTYSKIAFNYVLCKENNLNSIYSTGRKFEPEL